MKVLFTGKGKSGAWEIRGNQVCQGLRYLGIEADAIPKASVEQMRSYDIIVLVKRPTFELLDAIRQSGKPFAWDVVDSWPQPDGNEWNADRALTWLHTSIKDVRPNLLICSTRDMLADAEYANACVIYHHARPEYLKKRTNWFTVGYEGGLHYLGRYDEMIRLECEKRRLVWDRHSVENAVLAICLRDCRGYAPEHYKSNVKLANAQAIGIPALCSPESGYKETSTGGVIWIESPEDLQAAFDTLADPARYAELCASVDAPPTLAQIAQQYADQLARLC